MTVGKAAAKRFILRFLYAAKIVLHRLGLHKKGVLVYLGLHRGLSFDKLFLNYSLCYGFEANPHLFKELHQKYSRYPHVRLFNVAVATYAGEITFHISSNDGASSSIGEFNENWPQRAAGSVLMTESVKVPCINIYDFLRKEGVEYIDTYISDIQGMDLEVLKTLKPYFEKRKIGSITCEVAKNEKKNIYKLPDNSESGFESLVKENYTMVMKGWGIGSKKGIGNVPADWWEMDCTWELKNARKK